MDTKAITADQGYLLFLVGRKLGWIKHLIGLAVESPDGPAAAIEGIKSLGTEAHAVKLIGGAVEHPLATDAMCLAYEMQECICQADVPASWALADGDEIEAVRICEDAATRAHESVGAEMGRLSARCEVLGSAAFSGMKTDELNRRLGHDVDVLNKAVADCDLTVLESLRTRQDHPVPDDGTTANERMRMAVDDDPRRIGWAAKKWAKFLRCSVDHVYDLPMWKTVQRMKADEKRRRQKQMSEI